MKKISKILYYDDEYLDPKIPDSAKVLGNQEADFPFLVLSDVLSPKECDKIVSKIIKKEPYWNATIVSDENNENEIDKKVRNTVAYTLDDKDLKKYKKRMDKIKPLIEEYFKITLGATSGIQTLGYKKNFFYKLHADDSTPVFENGEFVRWSHTIPQRKITTILFLTDSVQKIKKNDIGSFIGGQVKFHYLSDINGKMVEIFPRKGALVVFPSNPYFSHSVENVEDGFRVSLVEWYDGVWNF